MKAKIFLRDDKERLSASRARALEEHEGYYALPCASLAPAGTGFRPIGTEGFSWQTCYGNKISFLYEGDQLVALVEGRRHGIPWRFLHGFHVLGCEYLETMNAGSYPWETMGGIPAQDTATHEGGLPWSLAWELE